MRTKVIILVFLILVTIFYFWAVRRFSGAWTDDPRHREGGLQLAQKESVLTTSTCQFYTGEDGHLRGGFIYKRDVDYIIQQYLSDLAGLSANQRVSLANLKKNQQVLLARDTTLLGESVFFFCMGALMLSIGFFARRSIALAIGGASAVWIIAFRNILVTNIGPEKYLAPVLVWILVFYARWLTTHKDPVAKEDLIAALDNENSYVRRDAAISLGVRKDLRAIEPLIHTLKDEELYVQDCASESLTKITGQDFGKDYEKWKEWWEQNKGEFLKDR